MRLSFDRLWIFLAVALPALAALIVPLPAVDLAYQVRTGDLILASRSIPAVDAYTFTAAGTPWTDQQWLAQVLLALGYRLGGWELLAVARAGLVSSTFGLVLAAAVARGAPIRVASILSLLSFVLAAPALALRPQLFGIAIFAGLLFLVADRRRHPRRLWIAPLLIVLWANVHGSVVLAPVLLAYAWLEDVVEDRDQQRSLAVLVVGSLATLVNPFGVGVWSYALGVGTNPQITGRVAEWQHTSPLSVPGLLFYGSVVAVAGLLIARRRLVTWPSLLWVGFLLVLGVWTVRALAWWPLGVVPVVASLLPGGTAERRPAPNLVNALVAAAVVVALVAALPWWRPTDPLTGRVGLLTYAPSQLAATLREEAPPNARVFAPQTWASWFEWAAPDGLVFVDSRIELFDAATWRDYDTVTGAGAGWQAVLDGHSVTYLLVRSGDPLAAAVASDRTWCAVQTDGDGALYRRLDVDGSDAGCKQARRAVS